ncbi:RidA family protein [Kineococcus sp. SYSU DK018]|uniref:RidA family protein n=1 Tax=Kineococcus sp. SYSU DK018 TaxID=3383139 RepID=UPI003D7C4FA7
MGLERINPGSLARPSGFSHAVRSPGLIHLSGQTALGPDGRIVAGGIVEQFRQALSNLLEALRAAGGAPADLASVTIYLLDIPEYQAHGRQIREVWLELVGHDYPAMTGVGVTGLWQPEALVEIQATAVVG